MYDVSIEVYNDATEFDRCTLTWLPAYLSHTRIHIKFSQPYGLTLSLLRLLTALHLHLLSLSLAYMYIIRITDHSCRYASPCLWNQLPVSLRHSVSSQSVQLWLFVFLRLSRRLLLLIGPVSKYRIFIPDPVLLDISWTSGVEQYGCNHNSLRESCKLYIFGHK